MGEFYIRPKRPNNTLIGEWQKMYVPLPIGLKVEVQDVCRERGVTQAELGLRLVAFALRHGFILEAALREEPTPAAADRSLPTIAVAGKEV